MLRWLSRGEHRRVHAVQRQRVEVGPGGWTCHVCGDYRPDERISVHATPIVVGGVEGRQNVRHCNDRAACVEGAAHVRFFPTTEEV